MRERSAALATSRSRERRPTRQDDGGACLRPSFVGLSFEQIEIRSKPAALAHFAILGTRILLCHLEQVRGDFGELAALAARQHDVGSDLLTAETIGGDRETVRLAVDVGIVDLARVTRE